MVVALPDYPRNSCVLQDAPKSGLISIIIASFNYAHFLPLSIESALRQRGVDVELIVIDDGSTDNTPDILRRYDSRMISRRQENLGLSAARNRGAELSRGEFIIFLDADDFLFPDAAWSQFNLLRKHPECGIAVCRSYFFRKTSQEGLPILEGEWRLFLDNLDVHLLHFNVAPPHAVMLRRNVIKLAGGFDLSLLACEDHDLWLRAAVHGFGLIANVGTQVGYRRHPDSMSHNMARQNLHDAILHERSVAAYLSDGFPADGRLEAGLACIAGCLTTAARLEKIDPDAASRQRLLAVDLAQRLSIAAPQPFLRLENRSYYVARLLLALYEPYKQSKTWALFLHRQLKKWIREIGADGLTITELKTMAEAAHGRLTALNPSKN